MAREKLNPFCRPRTRRIRSTFDTYQELGSRNLYFSALVFHSDCHHLLLTILANGTYHVDMDVFPCRHDCWCLLMMTNSEAFKNDCPLPPRREILEDAYRCSLAIMIPLNQSTGSPPKINSDSSAVTFLIRSLESLSGISGREGIATTSRRRGRSETKETRKNPKWLQFN